MPSPLKTAEGTSLSVLDEQGVFFCAGAQEIHLFNAPATFLWCCLERGTTLPELVAGFADTFRLSGSEARRRVARTLNDWSARGYLHAAPRQAAAPARRAREHEAPRARVTRPVAPLRSATLGLLGAPFRLELESAEHDSRVWPVVAHLASRDVRAPQAVLQVTREGADHVLRLDGLERLRCRSADRLAPAVKAELWQAAVNRHSYLMEIHAGVVFDGRGCTMLPGPPGRGKTTLTAALIRSGFRYLSDESAVLDRRTLNVRALPLALAVKQGAVESLQQYYPDLDELPVHRRADGVAVRYLAPPRTSRIPPEIESLPVRSLVFPEYAPGGPTRLQPISRPEALRRLLDQCLVLPGRLQIADVRDLVRWMRGLTCLELTFSSVDRAVPLLR